MVKARQVADKPKVRSPKKQISKVNKVGSKTTKAKQLSSKSEFSIAKKDLVTLPAIDMNDPEDKIVPAIMKMLTEVGFLHLRNVSGFSEERLLADVKEFHRLPDKVKLAGQPKHINKKNENVYRGWFPFFDNDVSHKEFFDMGCPLKEMSEEQKQYPLVEETPFPKEAKYK